MSPPTSRPIPPLDVVVEPPFEFPESCNKPPSTILHASVYVSMQLSPFISPSPSYPPPAPHVHKSLFSKSPAPIAALQISSSVWSFQVPDTCINICYLFLHLASCTHHYSPRFIHVIAWIFSSLRGNLSDWWGSGTVFAAAAISWPAGLTEPELKPKSLVHF